MNTREILDEIEFLTQTETRLKILVHLRETPCSCAELQQHLDVHRTTICKNIKYLKNKNYIEEISIEDTYHILPTGEIIIDMFSDLVQGICITKDLGSFLDRFPNKMELDPIELSECNIIITTEQRPYAPMNAFIQALQETNVFYGVIPTIAPPYIESIVSTVSDGMKFRAIVDENFNRLLQSNHPSELNTLVQADNSRLFITDDTLSFAVGLTSNGTIIATYDEFMRIHSVLMTNEKQQVIKWAKQQYESIKKTAEVYN